jgi:hypothetical protein
VATAAASIAVMALVVNSLATNLNGQRFDDALDIALTDTHIIAGCTYVVGLASLVLVSWARAVLGKDAALLWAQTVDSC